MGRERLAVQLAGALFEDARVRLKSNLLQGANKLHEIFTRAHVQRSATINNSRGGKLEACLCSAGWPKGLDYWMPRRGGDAVCVIIPPFVRAFVALCAELASNFLFKNWVFMRS